MKTVSKFFFGAVAIAVTVGLIILIFKIITGAFTIISGLLNTIIAIVVILALIAIVIWMFRYASRKR